MKKKSMPEFKKIISARFLYTVAIQIQAVVLGWQMYVLTHDPLYLGLIGLAEALPALGLALFAGYIVDRSKPLNVLKWVIGIGFLSGVILLGSHSGVALTIKTQIVALFLSSFLTGIARAFFHPAIYTAVPRLVPREQLPKVAAWMTSSYQIASISGPAIGGLLFGFAGIKTCAVVICALIFFSFISVLCVRASLSPSTEKQAGPFRKELFSGLQFVFNHPILFPALSLDMLSVLFGGVTALLPIYAAEILHIGPAGLGILRASPAVGASIVSLALTRIEIKQHAGRWLLSAVSGFGICIMVFAVSKSYTLSLVALGLSGAFDSVSAVIRSTIVQLTSPEEMRGRISAVNMIFISSSNELGEFESGIAARLLGPVGASVFGGILCLGTVISITLFCPQLRRLNMNDMLPKKKETSAQ